jgi:spore germination cell wall hydrolase CwlJ-like protein
MMGRKLHKASAVSLAVTMLFTLVSAEGSGAAAQSPVKMEPAVEYDARPVVQPIPAPQSEDESPAEAVSPRAPTLAALVAAQPQSEGLSSELNCLAGAIYFESKSEPLAGQLAVARVIVARTKSGRYPTSYCGVVYQPGQFSFIRGHSMPGINKASRDWHDAVAIAKIADAGAWRSPAEGAISFHAARVSPRWRMTRVAQVGNHVFYR